MSAVANLSAQSNKITAQQTLKQGLTRIFARNQKNDERPLTTWHVEMGDCRGRLGASCSTIQSTSACSSSHQNSGKDKLDANSAIHDWIASSLFTKPVPAHLDVAIRSALEASNQEFSKQCGGLLAGWDDLQGPSLVPSPLKSPDSKDSACWEVMTPRDWCKFPLGRRTAVGHELL